MNGTWSLEGGAAEPNGVTHAVSVDGSASAFLTMTGKRLRHHCEIQLSAGWYALHVKAADPDESFPSDVVATIPPNLPVDCIIGVIELGSCPQGLTEAAKHTRTICKVVALQKAIGYSFTNLGVSALDAKAQADLRAALPDPWEFQVVSNQTDSSRFLGKRSQPPTSAETAKRWRQEDGARQACVDLSTPEAKSECCERALAEFGRDASKQIAELKVIVVRGEDALLKAECRIAATEAERQRCEQTLASVQQETECRIAAAEADAASRVAVAERAAKLSDEKLLRTKFDILRKEKDLRAKIEQEVRNKLDAEVNAAERARVVAMQGVDWQYEVGGRFCSFDAASSSQLLRAYMLYSSSPTSSVPSSVTITSGSHMYAVDFETMQQTNLNTGKSRAVKLKCEVPDTWQKPPKVLMLQQSLSQIGTQEDGTEVWHIMQELLRRTAHDASAQYPVSSCAPIRNARICNVRRVENHALWIRYQQHIAQMEMAQTQAGVKAEGVRGIVGSLKPEFADMLKELSGENFTLNHHVNEQWLLHGTDPETANKIIEGGFDPRVSSTSGLYGAGTYFSSQACKCHQYTTPPVHTVLLSRVALGMPFYTKTCDQSLRRPPPLRNSTHHLHGCVVANEGPMTAHPHGPRQAHQEFIIFNGAQAFPQYVVSYAV